MQIKINNQDTVLLPELTHVFFGTDDTCDVALDIKTKSPQKICSIICDKIATILEVFNYTDLYINDLKITEMAILHAGDIINVGKQKIRIIDENKLPKTCSSTFKKIKKQNLDDQLSTSVSGLRSFNQKTFGQLAIIGSQSNFTHEPSNSEDIPFSVSYLDENLVLLCKKGKNIYINGNKANYAILKNGDYITTDFAKYCVESPGTSSFSKYSPSHPKNIQLSEEYLTNDNIKPVAPNTIFLKNNLWWITLSTALVIIAIVLYFIINTK